MYSRLAQHSIFDEKFGRQMRFIAGPRQCGKTTLAKNFLKLQNMESLYFNWDSRLIRTRYRESPYFFAENLPAQGKQKSWVCFDEIHKMPKWKNILKDFFDSYEDRCQFIVTGSARLDLFRKSGDSMAGRYFLFRIFPLVLCELTASQSFKCKKPPVQALDFVNNQLSAAQYHQNILDQLLHYSGFPEPFQNASEEFLNHWRDDYMDRLIREDLRDLTRIHELENVATLVDLLSHRIGSPLSINSLREDLETSYNAVRNYLRALNLCYTTFTILPYSKKIQRAVKKETKLYFFDWSRVKDETARFENYVAVELCAITSLWQNAGWGKFELAFVRTRDGKESDFLVVKDGKPWLLIEVKLSDLQIASHHINQAQVLGDIPFVQIVQKPNVCRIVSKNHFVVSASRFFAAV